MEKEIEKKNYYFDGILRFEGEHPNGNKWN